MVRDFSKLMLRAYNAEADNCVQSVRPHRLQAAIERLSKVRDTIARLGSKERSHYPSALAKLRANGEDTTELEAKLAEIGEEISSVEAREANIRAGYVYVISNVGAFGPDVVKIGMTRRLEPEDHIRELGDASAPFKFDTHALIFSDDAVGLESKLHYALESKRVNQVNLRREFFYATPAEVRVLLEDFAGQHLLEYHETAEALE